jgi:hypothetical protein
MFTTNADGSLTYAPPDQPVQHALVVTESFTRPVAAGFKPPPYPKGWVLEGVGSRRTLLGHTNVASGQGPRHPKAALIEHATAKVGDVLPDDEVTPAIATAAAKTAAVQKYRAAEAAKPPPPAPPPPLNATELAAVRALIAAKPAT